MIAEQVKSQDIKRFLSRFETQRLIEVHRELERASENIAQDAHNRAPHWGEAYAERQVAILRQFMAGFVERPGHLSPCRFPSCNCSAHNGVVICAGKHGG